jgi:hypothetical protein
MHLRRLIRGPINAINRDRLIVWFESTGPIYGPGGVATPTFAQAQPVFAQVQPLSTQALAHMEQLNIQGVLRQVYLRNAVASAVRANGTGGDLLQFPERFTDAADAVMAAWTADSQIITADSSTFTASGTAPVPPHPIRTWLVVLVNEQWDSWCRVTVQMQNDLNTAFTADSSTTADSTVRADA